MAVPLILGIGAAVLGAAAHMGADDTNLRAESINSEAKKKYNEARKSLEDDVNNVKQALGEFGEAKYNVVRTSVYRFIVAYNKIKDVELIDAKINSDLKNFNVSYDEIKQTQKMIDIYGDALSSGALGVGTGAFIALGANGMLPLLGSVMGSAGSLLAMGEIGLATSLAGSALSLGVAMTPLSAVAAPLVLFTGISASLKADENLEKAKVQLAKVEAAVEKIRIEQDKCVAIKDRTVILLDLLKDLNYDFEQCVSEVETIVKNNKGLFSRNVNPKKLSEEELRKIAMARAIFGAIKQILDTQLIGKDEKVTPESELVIEECDKLRLLLIQG